MSSFRSGLVVLSLAPGLMPQWRLQMEEEFARIWPKDVSFKWARMSNDGPI